MIEPISERDFSWSASVHDQSQVEMVFDYTAKGDATSVTSKECSDFELTVFFFMPKNLHISSRTFPKDKLFRHLKNFIRIHTPELPHFKTGYLPLTSHYLELGVRLAPRLKIKHNVAKEIKVFGNYVNLQLKNIKARSLSTSELESIFRELKLLIEKFRDDYVHPYQDDKVNVDKEVRKALRRVNEYISNRFLVATIDYSDRSEEIRAKATAEDAYRKLTFREYNLEKSEKEREWFYLRFSNLKKFVSEGLYLKLKQKDTAGKYKNIFAAVAAALAALFANLAQVERGMSTGASDYGFRSMFMLGVAVSVYVFKDRIKDLSKEYFNQRMKDRLPDQDTELTYQTYDSEGLDQNIVVGNFYEYVKYINETELPDEIRYVREVALRDKIRPPCSKKILCYRKRVWLGQDVVRHLGTEMLSLKDIFRFNISEFLPALDDPIKDINYLEDNDEIKTVKAPKNYYLDLLLQLSSKRQTDYKKSINVLRLVLNKNGLVRLEPLTNKDSFTYIESSA